MRSFPDLSEREILALAISNEEEDGRIYADYAAWLREHFPHSARLFDDMATEEDEHRRALIDLYVARFGDHIPYVHRREVRGAPVPASVASITRRGVDAVRGQAARMEADAARFYSEAMRRTEDADTRKLLGDLAAAEREHMDAAAKSGEVRLPGEKRDSEDKAAQQQFVLQIVQPGLVGLMDGSVSTLAPVFAAAFATEQTHAAFLVGFAASIGAGISMGFAEALADDGKLSGRGTPWLRGLVCGAMTIAGGIGHTLPFLLPDFMTAMILAAIVVVLELGAIAWIQYRYMDTPPLSAVAKVMLGGGLVIAAGALIGSA